MRALGLFGVEFGFGGFDDGGDLDVPAFGAGQPQPSQLAGGVGVQQLSDTGPEVVVVVQSGEHFVVGEAFAAGPFGERFDRWWGFHGRFGWLFDTFGVVFVVICDSDRSPRCVEDRREMLRVHRRRVNRRYININRIVNGSRSRGRGGGGGHGVSSGAGVAMIDQNGSSGAGAGTQHPCTQTKP